MEEEGRDGMQGKTGLNTEYASQEGHEVIGEREGIWRVGVDGYLLHYNTHGNKRWEDEIPKDRIMAVVSAPIPPLIRQWVAKGSINGYTHTIFPETTPAKQE